jgi:GNAT superfamily N-acetyltransferase
MQIKCFECAAPIEAPDTDHIVEAFVAHGKQQHTWSYPEHAIRTYARNFAEATLRLTGPTERRPEIGGIVVHPVTEERIDDWLAFFDHDAFADNPDWASCYCLEPHAPTTAEEPERAWRDSRGMMIRRLRDGASFGYLAYVDGRTGGWVNASNRSDYGLYANVDPNGPAPGSVIGVSCYVIAPPYRGHRVASVLLDRVIEDAAGRGASWIEGYPHNEPQANDAAHYRGPKSMYEARGFVPVEVQKRFTVMRRPVGRDPHHA